MINYKVLFKAILVADIIIFATIMVYAIGLIKLSINPLDSRGIFLIFVGSIFMVLTGWLQKKSQEYNVYDSWQQTKKIFSGPRAYK